MSSTSLAVLTKARAKFGKQLKEQDYNNLLSCQSVAEVMVYLKSHTHFSSVLAEVNERDVHRGRLEMLLRQNQFYEFDSLCRYDSEVSSGFSRFIIERTEIEQILRFLILQKANSTDKFIFQFPAYFSKHTEIDVNKLANARSDDEILEALKKSPYHKILSKYKPDSEGKWPVSDIEMSLYGYVFANLLDTVVKNTKGQERNELRTMLYTINDYMTFSRILRLKKYYDLPPERIKDNLFIGYTSISNKLIDQMCAAKSSAEVFSIMQKSGSGRMINKIGYNYAGDITPRVEYRLAKKNLRFSTNPSVVMLSYMFASDTELMNLISLIEGVRYNVDAKTIKSLLIL